MGGHDVHREDMFDEDPMLAAFARDLQDAAAATPAPAIGASLAAVLEGHAPATVYPDVVETPRARVVRRPAGLRWAVAAGALTVAAGSLGVAGALPGPVQRQVARMAEVIGIDVPDGEDDETTPEPPTTTTTSTTSTTIATTTSTAPPVGTTVLSSQQEAGEDQPGKPDRPTRADEDRPDRGRSGEVREDDGTPGIEDEGGRPGSVDLDDAEPEESTEPGSGSRDGAVDSSDRGSGAEDLEDRSDEPLDEEDDAKSSEQA